MNIQIKKIAVIISFSITALIGACGSSSEKSVNAATSQDVQKRAGDNLQHNLELSPEIRKTRIAQSDCLSCYNEQKKLVGPAFIDVAKNIKRHKLISINWRTELLMSGSGVWGEIPMPAHPDLSLEDSKKMVKFILSLTKEGDL